MAICLVGNDVGRRLAHEPRPQQRPLQHRRHEMARVVDHVEVQRTGQHVGHHDHQQAARHQQPMDHVQDLARERECAPACGSARRRRTGRERRPVRRCGNCPARRSARSCRRSLGRGRSRAARVAGPRPSVRRGNAPRWQPTSSTARPAAPRSATQQIGDKLRARAMGLPGPEDHLVGQRIVVEDMVIQVVGDQRLVGLLEQAARRALHDSRGTVDGKTGRRYRHGKLGSKTTPATPRRRSGMLPLRIAASFTAVSVMLDLQGSRTACRNSAGVWTIVQVVRRPRSSRHYRAAALAKLRLIARAAARSGC